MPKIDKTIDSAIGILMEEARIHVKSESGIWQGKKVISVAKWNKMAKKSSREEMFGFIPDEHVESPFGFMDITFQQSREYSEWYRSWSGFLISKKDAKYGKSLCHGCIVNVELDKWGFTNPPSASIRNLILKHPIANDVKSDCPVNVFKCPYKQLDKNNDLFELAKIWKIVHDALMEAHNRTRYDHRMFFELDFERGISWEQRNWFVEPTHDSIAMSLHGHKLSVVAVETIQDIFNVLTDMRLLELVLEQYIQHIAKGDLEYTGKIGPYAEERTQELRENKDRIVKFFSEIKDLVKMDELRGFYERTMKDEKDELGRKEKTEASILKWNPEFEKYLKKQRSGTCITCAKFSNIHCLNCGDWICDEHWEEHGRIHHNKTSTKQQLP